jgi:hypothetical protein
MDVFCFAMLHCLVLVGIASEVLVLFPTIYNSRFTLRGIATTGLRLERHETATRRRSDDAGDTENDISTNTTDHVAI